MKKEHLFQLVADITMYALLIGMALGVGYLCNVKAGWLFGGFMSIAMFITLTVSQFLNARMGNEVRPATSYRIFLALMASICMAVGLSI